MENAIDQGPSRGNSGRWMATGLIALGLFGVLYAGVQEAKRMRHLAGGQPAAAFTLETWEGGKVSLAALRGKVVMIDFWATWCPPCVEEMPTLVKLAKEYESRGLVFVAASRDEPETWKTDVSLFAERSAKDLTRYVAWADDATGDAYHVSVLPTLYFVDRQGNVQEAYSGFADEKSLRARIEQALEAKP